MLKGSQGTWEILSSPPERNSGVGLPHHEVQVVRSEALVTARSESRAPGGTAKRRQRSAAGRTAGSRSTSYYRRSRGTVPTGPGGGKGVPIYGT